MATRSILDEHGNVIGQLSLPDETTEEIWAETLALYTPAPVHVDPSDIVKAKIRAARVFGQDLIYQYGTHNVMSGFTVEQIQSIMDRTTRIVAALTTGSLYVAIAELNAIETDDIVITPDVIKTYRNKIEDFLGIART